MNYELAKQVKDAGFPHKHINHGGNDGYDEYCEDQEFLGGEDICIPKLSELIEACGDDFWKLIKEHEYQNWAGISRENTQKVTLGSTPEEAVARLWLALQK